MYEHLLVLIMMYFILPLSEAIYWIHQHVYEYLLVVITMCFNLPLSEAIYYARQHE